MEYKNNLSNKCILFVTATDSKSTSFEALFMPQNFKHLTGAASHLSGADFFDLAVRNRLSPNQITLANDGTTDLKLDVLPQLMNIHRTARMVGNYDFSRSLLIADKVAGTVTAALGFIQSKNFYLPKTALKADVRDITIQSTRRKIAAIFVKQRGDELFSHLTYIAKGMTIHDEIFTSVFSEKVDMQNLVAITTPDKSLETHSTEIKGKTADHDTNQQESQRNNDDPEK